MSDFVCGANEEGYHLTGSNWGRDLPEPTCVADIRNVVAGDPSPDGKGVLAIQRGIEVGHVFLLGTRTARRMSATFLDERRPSRSRCRWAATASASPASSARRSSRTTTTRGMIWPHRSRRSRSSSARSATTASAECRAAADHCTPNSSRTASTSSSTIAASVPGAMFADWELIGVPHRVVLSDRGLKDGQVEYQGRPRHGGRDRARR